MVEGARLESVYAGNRIWGSNPHLSAISELESAILVAFLSSLVEEDALERRIHQSDGF